MANTPLLVKLRTKAALNAGLTSLLGAAPFRWYNMQLAEGSAFPAITAMKVSGIPFYNVGQRGPSTVYRIQFTIWEDQVPDDTNSVLQALRVFLDSFSAVENTAQYPVQILNERGGLYPLTQPPIYQTSIDALIYNADNL